MSITYAWSIAQLDCKPELGGFQNVVTTVHWRLIGTDGNHSADVYGSAALSSPKEPFTAYANLTAQQVEGWVQAALGEEQVQEYRAAIASQIESAAPAARPSLPWVVPDLVALKAQGKARVDVAAGAARLKYITDAPGQDLTYDRKRREALQAIDDPTPTAQKYPVLAASIGIEVPTTGNAKTDFDAVCTLVISRETAWAAAASQIEALRLGGKQQVGAATSPAQVAEIVSAAETALAAL